MHLGTEDTVGRAAVLGARAIWRQVKTGFVQLDLEQPVGALWGDRVVLRDHGGAAHAGRRTGRRPVRRRGAGRGRPERLAVLAALARSRSRAALERLLDAAGSSSWRRSRWPATSTPEARRADLRAGGLCCSAAPRARWRWHRERLAQLGDKVVAALAEWHRAQPDALGPARPALFAAAARRGAGSGARRGAGGAIAEGRVVRDGAVLRLPEHQPRLTREDERLWQRVEPLLAVDDLRPPRVRELAEALGLEPSR